MRSKGRPQSNRFAEGCPRCPWWVGPRASIGPPQFAPSFIITLTVVLNPEALELINKSVVIKSFPTVRDNPDGTIRNTDFQRSIFLAKTAPIHRRSTSAQTFRQSVTPVTAVSSIWITLPANLISTQRPHVDQARIRRKITQRTWEGFHGRDIFPGKSRDLPAIGQGPVVEQSGAAQTHGTRRRLPARGGQDGRRGRSRSALARICLGVRAPRWTPLTCRRTDGRRRRCMSLTRDEIFLALRTIVPRACCGTERVF